MFESFLPYSLSSIILVYREEKGKKFVKQSFYKEFLDFDSFFEEAKYYLQDFKESLKKTKLTKIDSSFEFSYLMFSSRKVISSPILFFKENDTIANFNESEFIAMIRMFEKPIAMKALREDMKQMIFYFRFNATIVKFPTLLQRLLKNKEVESTEKLFVVKFEYKKGNEVF
ncbi:hypothetical protein TMA_121 [Thermus phage TMA]|uniref:hypothetical protein n=1 Tax=Thermus phage TMA TaxID=699370 RepID=UPI00021AADE9|nr:hypothetical protein TMA_121 [Thermus phage TMA]BAK53809.1 hypothetical protein TMA_121 [Thermus phage TMA]